MTAINKAHLLMNRFTTPDYEYAFYAYYRGGQQVYGDSLPNVINELYDLGANDVPRDNDVHINGEPLTWLQIEHLVDEMFPEL